MFKISPVVFGLYLLLYLAFSLTITRLRAEAGPAWTMGPAMNAISVTHTTIGTINLYDPSGTIRDARTGQPVAGATVTLYQVPGWSPKTGPTDTRPNTCESNASKAAGVPWSQPAPIALGIIVNPQVTTVAPALSYQLTDNAGYYGWDVSAGCWYVHVTASGYVSFTSPVVGVPPAVTDLNLVLLPTAPATTAQLIKSATPAVTVTNGSALTYTLVLSASADTVLHLYDPLDSNLAWQGFVGNAPGTLAYAGGALTGTVALAATMPFTVTFAVQVNLPAASFVNEYAQLRNTAYYFFAGETDALKRPSNTQVNVVHHVERNMLYLPLVMRNR